MTFATATSISSGSPVVERKVLPLSEAKVVAATGEFSGYAAVFGNRDDGGDIIEPGFFAPVLDDFLKEGFISWAHDWETPVGYPTSAVEDPKGLRIAGMFHSTPAAQEARTVTSERLAAGKSMGLSIGYEIAPDGKRVTPEARHLTKAARLFEVGIVTVPMNREAGVAAIKAHKAAAANVSDATYVLTTILRLIEVEAADLEPADPDVAEDVTDVTTLGAIRDLITSYIATTAQEVGTPDDLADIAQEQATPWGYLGHPSPIAEHVAHVLAANNDLQKRLKNLARIRSKEGRVLSAATRERLQGHPETLTAIAADLVDLLASADTGKGRDFAMEFETAIARSLGVHLPT